MKLHDGTMEIFDRMQKKILKVKISENRTFQVKLGAFDSQCLNAETKSDESWLWHMRYGHLNFKDLNLIHAKDIVTGLPQVRIPKSVCDHCMISKQTRASFSNYTPTRANDLLHVVYSDVCGPFEVLSLGGKRFFVSFVDEFSRKMWTYLLKVKSEVFENLKKFTAMTEKQSRKKLKILRTNGGGKFNSIEIEAFCTDKGILHEVTAPYTPQHNGVVERRNRTIMNMVRSMLRGKNLPKALWREAVVTTTYVLNRCPTQQLKNQVPEVVWSRKTPSVKHMRVFGLTCYRHIPNQTRKKLDDKSEHMIFVGYNPTGSYKLLNPRTNQIVFSRDVQFDELNTWMKDKHDPSKKPIIQINIETLSEPEPDDVTGEVQAKPTGAVQVVEGRRSTKTRSLPTRV